MLKIVCPNILGVELPVSIVKPKGFKNKIGVYSALLFNNNQQKDFHALESLSKDEIMNEFHNGLAMMGLVPIFIPEEKEFNQIAFQELIYLDGISQDRILHSISKMIMAYSYLVRILEKYKILRNEFDPSRFV